MGFFLREAARIVEWSASTLNSLKYLPPDEVVEEVGGSYSYYCYVLAGFDPLRAQEIHDNATVEQVTRAVMAQFNYNRPKDA